MKTSISLVATFFTVLGLSQSASAAYIMSKAEPEQRIRVLKAEERVKFELCQRDLRKDIEKCNPLGDESGYTRLEIAERIMRLENENRSQNYWTAGIVIGTTVVGVLLARKFGRPPEGNYQALGYSDEQAMQMRTNSDGIFGGLVGGLAGGGFAAIKMALLDDPAAEGAANLQMGQDLAPTDTIHYLDESVTFLDFLEALNYALMN